MAEVFQFPSESVREWSMIEANIRGYLSNSSGCFDQDLIEHVIAQTKVFYNKYINMQLKPSVDIDLVLPVGISLSQIDALMQSIDKAFQDKFRQVQDTLLHIIIDRVDLEVKLYLGIK